jgi:hypothetical protein
MSKLLSPLLFSEDMTTAAYAERLAFYCHADTVRAMADDVPIVSADLSKGYVRLECLSNVYGCVLGEIASPGFDPYAARVMDGNAHLRLVAALLRMRADTADTRPLSVRLKATAGEIGLGKRRVDIGPDGRSLQLQNYRSDQTHWGIPLPAYFHTPVTADSP